MSYLDDILSRMIKYAEGLGIKVRVLKHKQGLPGALWENDANGDMYITLYTWPRQTKTLLILNLLHELGHARSYIMDGRMISARMAQLNNLPQEEFDKEQRKVVYKEEVRDSKYRIDIANELNLKIPLWKIQADIALDRWIYLRWYKTGIYPTYVEQSEKKQAINRKYNH